MIVWSLGLAVALAQTPADTDVPVGAEAPPVADDAPPADDEVDDAVDDTDGIEPLEVIVYSELLVRQAREKLMQTAAAEGYTDVIRKKGRTILRHDAMPWKGEVVLYDSGRVEVKRQPVRFEPALFDPDKPLSWISCVIPILCLRTGGQTVSKRRYRSYERNVMAAIEPEIRDWNEKISDLAIDRKVGTLGERLTALWEQGVPLEGDTPIPTPEGRKAALVAFWDSRTDNDWGVRVQQAVEAFVRAEVQTSAHPFTPDELARIDATRQSLRAFDVVRGPFPDALDDALDEEVPLDEGGGLPTPEELAVPEGGP